MSIINFTLVVLSLCSSLFIGQLNEPVMSADKEAQQAQSESTALRRPAPVDDLGTEMQHNETLVRDTAS